MIGIDCGGRKVAIVDIDRLIFHVYQVTKTGSRGAELRAMSEHLCALELGDGPKWVESPLLAGVRNIQSTIAVSQMSGVVHACLSNTHPVAVSSWKQRTVGKGNADKSAVRAWLEEEHPDLASLCRGDQDLIDAACIALYGRTVHEALAAGGLRPL